MAGLQYKKVRQAKRQIWQATGQYSGQQEDEAGNRREIVKHLVDIDSVLHASNNKIRQATRPIPYSRHIRQATRQFKKADS